MNFFRVGALCLMAGLLATPAMAQKGLKLGAFFLPQTSFLYNADDFALDEDLYQVEILPGMAGGINFGYNFNDVIGVRMNVIYSQEGGRYSARRDFTGRDAFTTRLEYLKVPVMVGFNTDPLFNKVLFAVYAGVQGNMMTRGWSYSNNPVYAAPSPEGAYRVPATEDLYERWTYSAVLDLGADIYLTPKSYLNLRLRGDLGLTDSENKDATYLFRDGGTSSSANYWDWRRGAGMNAETFPLNVGILFGFTYTLGKDTGAIPTPPTPVDR